MRKTITSQAIERKTVNRFLDKIKTPNNIDEFPQVIQNQMQYEVKRDRVLVEVLYITASRISETLQLRKKDFNFTQKNSRLYEIDMINLKNKGRETKHIGFPADDSFSNEIKDYVKKLKKNMILINQGQILQLD